MKFFLSIAAVGTLLALALGSSSQPATQARPADASAVSSPRGLQAAKPVADPDRPRLLACWAMVDRADWGKAIDGFEAIVAGNSTVEAKAEATFGLGHVWQYRRPGANPRKARRYLEQVVEQYGQSKATPWAMLTLARIIDTPEHEPKDADELQSIRDDARRRYEQILAAYPDNTVADEAALRLAVIWLSRRGDEEAEAAGSAILSEHLIRRPDNYLAATMHTLVGEHLQRQGEYRQAVNHYIAAADAGLPSMFHQAKACYRIARIAELHLKDYELAGRWYERLADETPGDNRYYPAKLAAVRCRQALAATAAAEANDEPGARP